MFTGVVNVAFWPEAFIKPSTGLKCGSYQFLLPRKNTDRKQITSLISIDLAKFRLKTGYTMCGFKLM
jgi:hypothetical protein